MPALLTGASIIIFAGVLAEAIAVLVARIILRRLLRQIPLTAVEPAWNIRHTRDRER